MKFSVTAALEASETAPILFRGNIFESIKAAQTIGYDSMEIHLRYASDIDDVRMKEYCLEKQFGISTIGTGMAYVIDKLSLTDSDKWIRKKAIQRLRDHVDLANKLDCAVIIGSIKGKAHHTKGKDLSEKYCLEGICELAEYAGGKNVILLLEPINRYELDYLNTVEETILFMDQIKMKNIKLLIDTFHMNIEETSLEQSINLCECMLGHVHLADSNRRYPGAGHLNFKSIIKKLRQIEYDDYAAFECLPFPDAITAAARGLENIKTINEKLASERLK
jgi:sugar phosphate isomerase/epimerase